MHEYEIGEAAREAATRTAASFMSEIEDKHHSPLTDGVQLVQAGERSSISHGRGSTDRLKDGDMVAMCFCLTNQFKGYKVGFARSLRWPRKLGKCARSTKSCMTRRWPPSPS